MMTRAAAKTTLGIEPAGTWRFRDCGQSFPPSGRAPASPRRTGAGRAPIAVAALVLLMAAAAPHAVQGQPFTVLHTFAGPGSGGTGADGAYSYARLTRDWSGTLYGTTETGGTYGLGTVFELCESSGTYTEKILYSFQGGSDGKYPSAGLIRDVAGNLYGAAGYGGAHGFGTLFELVYVSPGNYTFKVLWSFSGGGTDGKYPVSSLVMDSWGNLFGTTFSGGSSTNCSDGCGTVFEWIRASRKEKVLHSFGGTPDGALLFAGLIMDNWGNLYGTTGRGGTSGNGIVFELVHSSPSTYTERVLYSFGGYPDGGFTSSGLTMDPRGNLFGTTLQGGTLDNGTIYELAVDSSSPTGYTESLLYSFGADLGARGAYTGLAMDPAGNLYGATGYGGTDDAGTIYKWVKSSRTVAFLHSFAESTEGRLTEGDLMLDPSGNLAGAASHEGSDGFGTVFKFCLSLPFSAFKAKLDIDWPGFVLDGAFRVGAGGERPDPVTQGMILAVGPYQVTIPAGLFHGGRRGPYSYAGVIKGVRVEIHLAPTGANAYHFEARVAGVRLTPFPHPLPVTLTVGNHTGTAEAITH